MAGMSSLDENTLQQFSDIFKHFQTGKPEEEDEVFITCTTYEVNSTNYYLLVN